MGTKDNLGVGQQKSDRWYAVDQNGKDWSMHTTFNPANPMTMEIEAPQGLVEEFSVHLIISSLCIKLDSHETHVSRDSLKVMYEFLSNEDIVEDRATSNEGTLLRAYQPWQKRLQSADQ